MRESYVVERPGVTIDSEIIEVDGPSWLRTTAHGAPMAAGRAVFIHDSFVERIRDQASPFFSEAFFATTRARESERFFTAIAGADVVIFEATERAAFQRFRRTFASEAAIEELRAAIESQP
jgi:hypothetical protein